MATENSDGGKPDSVAPSRAVGKPFNRPGRKGKKNKGGKGNFYGGLGGYKGVNIKDVRKLVRGEMNRERRAIREMERDVKHQTRKTIKAANRDYRKAAGDLGYIRDEVGAYMGVQQDEINANYDKTKASTAAANAALQAQLQSNTEAGGGQVTAEMERLGIQGGANLSQMYVDSENAKSLAAVSGNNALATLDLQAAGSRDIGNLLLGMNEGQYQQGMGNAINARQNLSAEARLAKLQGLQELRKDRRDLVRSRPDLVFQLLQQMDESGWAKHIQRQQLRKS